MVVFKTALIFFSCRRFYVLEALKSLFSPLFHVDEVVEVFLSPPIMRESQLPSNQSTKVQDILDWANNMGQTHSDKNKQFLSIYTSKRREDKRLSYIGVKRRRTRSPLKERKEANSETCKKNDRKREKEPTYQKLTELNIHEYANNSCMGAFFKLFDDDIIQDFLWLDACSKISDKYLLAMVYAYFKRAELTRREYNRNNFFLALYLANDMEEDDEDQKYDILPWALGYKWRDLYPGFLLKRDKLWKKMGYRAVVSRRTCEEVMFIVPDHPIWQRTRKLHHGGAIREISLCCDDNSLSPRGPGASPLYCKDCEEDKDNVDSGSSGYLSSPQSISMDIVNENDIVIESNKVSWKDSEE